MQSLASSFKRHVLAVGMGCLDNRLFVDEFPPSTRRARVPRREDALGGPAAVGAVAAVRLGGTASLWGRRGDDETGNQIARLLESDGVDTSHYRAFPGTSPRCECFVRADGERFLFPFWGEGVPDDPSWIPDDAVAHADALLVDGRWEEGGLRLAQLARQRDIPVVVDFDLDTPGVWEIARAATHVIADEEMAKSHGGVDALLQKIKSLGAWSAVTLGDQGVAHKGGRISAYEVAVVDSTGAGDVFHGAFALAMAQRRSELEALQFATAAGALRCKLGKVPNLEQVEKLLAA